jgi:hypothetical protein
MRSAAYQQQIAVTSPKRPPPLAEKDPFESTAAYNSRREAYEAKVHRASEGNVEQIDKLKGEENLKLAQARLDYLEQQIKVVRPFIERLQALQARMFVLPGEAVSVELGLPDADRSCFPATITHKADRWTVDWKYSDPCGVGNRRRMQRYCELEFQAHCQFQENTALQCGQRSEGVSPDRHTLATGGNQL